MTAAKNTEAFSGANQIGNNLMSKFNLGALGNLGGGGATSGQPSVMASMQGLGRAGGYQPKMFGAKAGASTQSEAGDLGSDRYSGAGARFGAASNMGSSIDIGQSPQYGLAQSV